MSGAPRTIMVLIAWAASPRVFKVAVVNTCGNCVWSMISTDHPSGLVQIVLWCLPWIFMAGHVLLPCHSSFKTTKLRTQYGDCPTMNKCPRQYSDSNH